MRSSTAGWRTPRRSWRRSTRNAIASPEAIPVGDRAERRELIAGHVLEFAFIVSNVDPTLHARIERSHLRKRQLRFDHRERVLDRARPRPDGVGADERRRAVERRFHERPERTHPTCERTSGKVWEVAQPRFENTADRRKGLLRAFDRVRTSGSVPSGRTLAVHDRVR